MSESRDSYNRNNSNIALQMLAIIMNEMNKHILVVILLFSISPFFGFSQNKLDKSDIKYYQCNFDLLENGIEKKFIIKNKSKIDTAFNIQIKINDSLFSSTSNIGGSPTVITSVFKRCDDRYIEVESFMIHNKSMGKMTIIKPRLLPYFPSLKTLKSNYKYPTEVIYNTYNERILKYTGESDFLFKNDTLDCIVYKFEILITKKNIENNKETKHKKFGKIYYGEGIGHVYSEIINKSDTITWTLIDINEIEK